MNEDALINGDLYHFKDFGSNMQSVPERPGVYTVWDKNGKFLYAGTSGRRWKDEVVPKGQMRGLRDRLDSHYKGAITRGFGLEILLRKIVRNLSDEDRSNIDNGTFFPDKRVSAYIQEHLSYRVLETKDYQEACKIETRLRKGESAAGLPELNPCTLRQAQGRI